MDTLPIIKNIPTKLIFVVFLFIVLLCGVGVPNPIAMPLTPEQEEQLGQPTRQKLDGLFILRELRKNNPSLMTEEMHREMPKTAAAIDLNLPTFSNRNIGRENKVYISPSSIPKFSYKSLPNMASALTIDCLVDFIVLLIGYSIVRKISVIISWKFLLYFIFVVLGGLVIDAIGLLTIEWAIGFVLLGVVPLLLLFLYNWFLSRKYFGLTHGRAVVIGILMAAFTNPLIGVVIAGSDYSLWSDPEKARQECLMNIQCIVSGIRLYAENDVNKQIPKSLQELSVNLYNGQYFKTDDFSFKIDSLRPLSFTVAVSRPSCFQLGPKIIIVNQDDHWDQK